MCEIAHVTAHAAVIPTVFAALERFVGRMRTDLLENATENGIGQALGLVRAVVSISCGRVEVISRQRSALLGALLAPEALEEAHDASGGANNQLEFGHVARRGIAPASGVCWGGFVKAWAGEYLLASLWCLRGRRISPMPRHGGWPTTVVKACNAKSQALGHGFVPETKSINGKADSGAQALAALVLLF